jgi:lipopolysaccharide transport system permease protein
MLEVAAGTPVTEPETIRTEQTVTEISASGPWRGVALREVWEYRELLHILVWRDLKVRYRQTLLGAAWVMGQPLLTTLIFTLVFHRLARIESGALPYAVFALAGVLPWMLFASGVQGAANSLVGNSHLISKVYFPRVILPAAAVLSAMADFFVSGVMMGGVLAWYGIVPGAGIVLLPAVLLLALALALGLGLWLAALNVKYRDVRVLLPFAFQVWMFATPVVYPIALLPAPWRDWAPLNPAVGVVEGFRWCLFGGEAPVVAMSATFIAAVVLLASGVLVFRRMEREFVDVI